MTCEKCPLSLLCWSGKLSTEPDDTFLCPYCGNFTAKGFPHGKDRYSQECVAVGLTGFQCEKRPATVALREAWRVRRQLEMQDYALMVKDPAGFSKKIALKPCSFCRSS